jgi:hypothetical protein
MTKLPVAKMLLLLLALALLVAGAHAQAQSQAAKASDDDLLKTISRLDAEVFDAYNKCELDKFGSYLSEELEFYHDNGGLTNKTRESLVESVKKNICGKVQRQLVAGTLEVYPLHGYGAVEIGVHRFLHPGREKEDGVGEAKFVQLWQNKDGKWLLTRIISFDHHSADEKK